MKGAIWAQALLENARAVPGFPPSVIVLDGTIAQLAFRAISIVPNASARFPRARNGEFGLDEGLAVAEAVRSASADTAILSIVDAPGQVFGRREEAAGLHLSLAVAVESYVEERRRGRPIFALIVGKAISGAFLAHGMQAGWIGALSDGDVEIHVMPAASVARVTRSTDDEVARIASVVPATARDVATFAAFGALDALFDVIDSRAPAPAEIEQVRAAIDQARREGLGTRAPADRLRRPPAAARRALALDVRRRIDEAW
jgi:biotin-independent malonate decarboxylase gamma subunit